MKYKINPETKKRCYHFDYMTRDELIAEINAYANNNKFEIQKDLKQLKKEIKNKALDVALEQNRELANEVESLQNQLEIVKNEFVAENSFEDNILNIKKIFACYKKSNDCGYVKFDTPDSFVEKIKDAFNIKCIKDWYVRGVDADITSNEPLSLDNFFIDYHLENLERELKKAKVRAKGE